MIGSTIERGILKNRGDNGIRTRDLCVANATLSQLSYVPVQTVIIIAQLE